MSTSARVAWRSWRSFFFFFNDTATTEIYTLSLHDALPICHGGAEHHGARHIGQVFQQPCAPLVFHRDEPRQAIERSEEHTSELQSPCNLVCRLLLEKKKDDKPAPYDHRQQQRDVDYSTLTH